MFGVEVFLSLSSVGKNSAYFVRKRIRIRIILLMNILAVLPYITDSAVNMDWKENGDVHLSLRYVDQ